MRQSGSWGWRPLGTALGFLGGVVVASALAPALAGPDPQPPRPGQDLTVAGRLRVGQGVDLPGFRLSPGGTLEWPGKVRFGPGGGEGNGLPPLHGLIRAQPGGNLVLQPQGDYMRSAIDLLPPRGKQADLDPIGEFTIHRVPPTATTQEMISYSALARRQGVYAVVVEAQGEGQLHPLAFMVVRGGLRDPSQAFSAEAMRMTEDGTMVFGLQRQGGRLHRPLDSITIDQPDPARPGSYDSDALNWVGKAHDGRAVHRVNWAAQVHVEKSTGPSRLVIRSRVDDAAYRTQLEVTDRGELELPSQAGAVVLRSPNGKRWRLTVSDDGQLRVRPAESGVGKQ